jgi:hypothetical protein
VLFIDRLSPAREEGGTGAIGRPRLYARDRERMTLSMFRNCTEVSARRLLRCGMLRETRAAGVLQRWCFLTLALVAVACRPPAQSPQPAAAPGESLEFAGSWNAAGRRQTIPLGRDRIGSIIDLRGTLVLAGPGRPGVAFQSEVIGLADSATGFQGRSVWTDERGDQVYSELQGEGTGTANRITGTVMSGTGRYAGITGSYEFSWQWVMAGEEGAIHGRAADLKGRVQPGPAAAGSAR